MRACFFYFKKNQGHISGISWVQACFFPEQNVLGNDAALYFADKKLTKDDF